MTETLKKSCTSKGYKGFLKGVSGNPNGRPKGAISDVTKKAYKFRNMAAEKYEEAFKILWDAVEAKESWAHQIYFKELIPKRLKEESVTLTNQDKTLEGQIKALTEAISSFEDVTLTQAMDCLKILIETKKALDLNKEGCDTIIFKREELLSQVKTLDAIIELKEKEESE